MLVALKEVEEITAIFASYDIVIKELDRNVETEMTLDGEREGCLKDHSPSQKSVEAVNERADISERPYTKAASKEQTSRPTSHRR